MYENEDNNDNLIFQLKSYHDEILTLDKETLDLSSNLALSEANLEKFQRDLIEKDKLENESKDF